jgi:hypothetical protein
MVANITATQPTPAGRNYVPWARADRCRAETNLQTTDGKPQNETDCYHPVLAYRVHRVMPDRAHRVMPDRAHRVMPDRAQRLTVHKQSVSRAASVTQGTVFAMLRPGIPRRTYLAGTIGARRVKERNILISHDQVAPNMKA